MKIFIKSLKLLWNYMSWDKKRLISSERLTPGCIFDVLTLEQIEFTWKDFCCWPTGWDNWELGELWPWEIHNSLCAWMSLTVVDFMHKGMQLLTLYAPLRTSAPQLLNAEFAYPLPYMTPPYMTPRPERQRKKLWFCMSCDKSNMTPKGVRDPEGCHVLQNIYTFIRNRV